MVGAACLYRQTLSWLTAWQPAVPRPFRWTVDGTPKTHAVDAGSRDPLLAAPTAEHLRFSSSWPENARHVSWRLS